MTSDDSKTHKSENHTDPMLVYIVGGGLPYIRMFYDRGYRGAMHVRDADLVVFTGGEDVNPKLYGEEALKGTYYNDFRDEADETAFAEAMMLDIPCVGICRGAQFLNVMNQGKMWQDVDGHRGSHPATDLITGAKINVTSTHHQMMIPGKGAKIIAAAAMALNKQNYGSVMSRSQTILDDPEVVLYEDSKCLCFQPHPEFAHNECRDYFWEVFDRHITPMMVEATK